MKVIIDGNEYPIGLDFTYREMRLMKRVSGLRAGELFEALDAGDVDAAIALASVALKREDKNLSDAAIIGRVETMLDKEIGSITVDFTPEEPDASPPADAAPAPADAGK